MSFEAQERFLFDLLYDRKLRADFAANRARVFAQYGLDAEEQADFAHVRVTALELDASIRADLILGQFCRAFPLTFCLLSSVAGGLDLLKSRIDLATMYAAPPDRLLTFGKRIGEGLERLPFDTAKERSMVQAVHQAELGMVWTSTTLKQEVLHRGAPAPRSLNPLEVTAKPVRFAAFVSASLLPRSYTQLRQALCGMAGGAELWRRLNDSPLSEKDRAGALGQEDPRVLVAKAEVTRESAFESIVDHRTAELPEGFAPLMEHVNGMYSIDEILFQLKAAGAPDRLVSSVRNGFLQLVQAGMLEVV